MKIGILGAGGFGTALAILLEQYDYDIVLWSAVASEIEDIRSHGENTRLLSGAKINTNRIQLTTELSEVSDADIIIFAVASIYVRSVARQLKGYVSPGAILANVAKGLEQGSLKRLSEVIGEEIPGIPVAALSGPSHAEEIARGVPTTIVAACLDPLSAKKIQDALNSNTFRIYVNDDVIGVELGGALKNVIALAAGVCDGLGMGDNTKAALMTRGITEIGRLGVAAGAKTQTFAGLSGIGDLIVTCTSMHSRNRRAGILIGKGKTAEQAVEQIGMTVEGYIATRAAQDLARQYHVTMPITEQLYQILYQGADPRQALHNLMGRPARHESEHLWFHQP